jgi:hypothetical protein
MAMATAVAGCGLASQTATALTEAFPMFALTVTPRCAGTPATRNLNVTSATQTMPSRFLADTNCGCATVLLACRKCTSAAAAGPATPTG